MVLDTWSPNIGEYAIYVFTGIFSFVAMILSIHLMVRHHNNWKEPDIQISIVRIIMMVPIYSITSWMAILFSKYAVYFQLFRDSYESLVLYEFFCLIQSYFMRESMTYFSHLRSSDNDKPLQFVDYFGEYDISPWPFPCCILSPMVPGTRLFIIIKGCIIQYVFIKPILSFLAVLLYMKDFYHTGYFVINDAYLWITIICNISMSLTLYMLIIFYLLIADVIKPYKTLLKFLSIKILIFFIFWQSMIITLLSYFDFLPLFFDWNQYRSSLTIENIFVCVEMLLLSITHLWIYTYEPYKNIDMHV